MAFSLWEPFYMLHQQLQSLISDLLKGSHTSTLWVGGQGAAIDLGLSVKQTESSLVLTIQLPPNVTPSDLEVEVGWETLLIQGCCWQPIGSLKDTDTYPSWFQNLVPLPCPIHPEVAKAVWKDNSLTLTLLKLHQTSWQRVKLNLSDRDWDSQQVIEQPVFAGMEEAESFCNRSAEVS